MYSRIGNLLHCTHSAEIRERTHTSIYIYRAVAPSRISLTKRHRQFVRGVSRNRNRSRLVPRPRAHESNGDAIDPLVLALYVGVIELIFLCRRDSTREREGIYMRMHYIFIALA